jgi:xylulose-5-phosphate/fructose-6-phosphate phosphoketolase
MGLNPRTNPEAIELRTRPLEGFAVEVLEPGAVQLESTRVFGAMLREITVDNATNFRLFCPDETNSNRLGAVFDVDNRCLQQDEAFAGDDHVSADGRVMEVLSEHCCEGWLEGYVLTGRHGLFATYEAFALIVGSMTTQHAKWLEMSADLPWRKPVPSLNILLTSTCWRNDHNGFSHQGPGFMDTMMSKKGTVARVYLPPDANCLLVVAKHCFSTTNLVNLIIIDKQPQLQWLSLEAAVLHCERGLSVWHWAGNERGDDSVPDLLPDLEPDIVLACAGDIATLETLAAAAWLRARAPDFVVRVVNVVDLMTLFTPREHPHGKSDEYFCDVFTNDVDVIFAFHGYPGAVHHLLHGRRRAERFHVRGYKEEGTTTTPFDMVVLNETSRFHIVIDAIKRGRRGVPTAPALIAECERLLREHRAYILEHFEDPAEIRCWRWPEA